MRAAWEIEIENDEVGPGIDAVIASTEKSTQIKCVGRCAELTSPNCLRWLLTHNCHWFKNVSLYCALDNRLEFKSIESEIAVLRLLLEYGANPGFRLSGFNPLIYLHAQYRDVIRREPWKGLFWRKAELLVDYGALVPAFYAGSDSLRYYQIERDEVLATKRKARIAFTCAALRTRFFPRDVVKLIVCTYSPRDCEWRSIGMW